LTSLVFFLKELFKKANYYLGFGTGMEAKQQEEEV